MIRVTRIVYQNLHFGHLQQNLSKKDKGVRRANTQSSSLLEDVCLSIETSTVSGWQIDPLYNLLVSIVVFIRDSMHIC